MPNIQEQPTRPKGNGSEKSPHHRMAIQGNTVKRLEDGCRIKPTCEGCTVPLKKCKGSSKIRNY